jgi:hypothetical protein
VIKSHCCPEADGDPRPGDEFDCPACRAGLLRGFMEPASPPLPGPVPVPHVLLENHGRTVPLTEQEWLDGAPPDEAPEHMMAVSAVPHADRPGGVWSATCSCGWRRSGAYARDGMGRTAAARLARILAQRHLAHPDEPGDDA